MRLEEAKSLRAALHLAVHAFKFLFPKSLPGTVKVGDKHPADVVSGTLKFSSRITGKGNGV
jgi:hypothetical protein